MYTVKSLDYLLQTTQVDYLAPNLTLVNVLTRGESYE